LKREAENAGLIQNIVVIVVVVVVVVVVIIIISSFLHVVLQSLAI
jgi:hypothetical protein